MTVDSVSSAAAAPSRRAARAPLAVALVAGLALTACGSGGGEPAAPGAAAPVTTETTLGPATGSGPGYSYNPAAPEGAGARVVVTPSATSTQVMLTVSGMQPNRGYAAHAHARPCGATGGDAGPHYQNQVDPAATPDAPSSDPAYANPTNEVWLDLRTDAAGTGTATVTAPWTTTPRAPASVIIHEAMVTATEPGEAGTAGGRLGCVTAPFA